MQPRRSIVIAIALPLRHAGAGPGTGRLSSLTITLPSATGTLVVNVVAEALVLYLGLLARSLSKVIFRLLSLAVPAPPPAWRIGRAIVMMLIQHQ